MNPRGRLRLRRRQQRRTKSKTKFSSPILTWAQAKHSTPVRSLQQSHCHCRHWTRFGAFHATCTYNDLCLSLFTFTGHHNNSFAKCCFNRTVIWSWTMFGTVRWTCSLYITFSDVLFRVSSLKIPFWWSESGSKKTRSFKPTSSSWCKYKL